MDFTRHCFFLMILTDFRGRSNWIIKFVGSDRLDPYAFHAIWTEFEVPHFENPSDVNEFPKLIELDRLILMDRDGVDPDALLRFGWI